ncbi:MAG: amidohydrolase family protein, partial [Psychrobium sp.]
MSLLRIPMLLLIGSLLVSLEARADKVVDTLISNGRILTMNSGMVEYDRGFVAIKGHKIVAVGMQQNADEYSAKEVIDVDGDLIIPGLVNGHTHVSMTLLRSLGDDVPNRLHDYIFPLEKEFVTPAMVALGAELGNLEFIKGGVTTFADMYYFEDEVAKVVDDSGLRAILGQTVIKYLRADAPTPQDAINATLKFAQKYQDHERITAAFALHGPYTNSTEILQQIARLSLAHDIPVLMHLAESKVEQQTIAKRAGGLSPIAYMNDIGALNHNLIGAHVIIADHQDRELLKKHDVGVIHNISANIKSARSVAPVIEMLEQGIDV